MYLSHRNVGKVNLEGNTSNHPSAETKSDDEPRKTLQYVTMWHQEKKLVIEKFPIQGKNCIVGMGRNIILSEGPTSKKE